VTVWDKIYKNFQNGGEAWATLTEDMLPQFLSFVNENNFVKKNALDIGCGTGKYLIFLKNSGFYVSGIDSSESAVEMTKNVLGNNADVSCVDMFDYEIPKNKFDLIFSISAIHHGFKDQVVKLINQIYDKLATGGAVFITLPDIESNKKWNTFKSDKEIAPGTYAPQKGPEKGLAHSFFGEQEIRRLFPKFKGLNLELDSIGRWYITGKK
jgi:SAM-dependent methyltransferase